MTTTTPQTSASLSVTSLGEISPPEQMVKHRPRTGSRSIWSSIRLKAALLAVAIGTIPVMAIGGAAYYFANQSIEKKITHEQQAKTVELADKLNLFLFERFGDIQVLAELPFLVDPKIRATTSLQDKVAQLSRYAELYEVYDSIAVVDLDGNAIIEAGKAKAPGNIASRKYFQLAKGGKIAVGDLQVSKVTGKPSVFFAAPLRDKETKQIIGVVRTRIPTETLQRLAKNYIEGTEEYLFADASGKIFSAKEEDDLNKGVKEVFAGLEELEAQKQSGAIFIPNNKGQGVELVGYAPLSKFESMPATNWSALTVADRDLVLKAQQDLLFTLAVGTGIAALVVGTLAIWLANRFAQPISQATIAVEKLGQGELDIRLQTKGNDELAILGTNINQMADRIQTLLGNLQESSAQIQRQSDLVVQDSEVLQADVGHILDVVSAVEEGDLTVQAEVSDRATGLVSDTLNRLIEELAQIVAAVLFTTQQVTHSADDLKQLATTAAQQVGQQTQSVGEVENQMAYVNHLSQVTVTQTEVSDEAVQQARTAVNQGQQEMVAVLQGISSLQQGTEQIAKRTQTLTEFVASAAQFAKDQKRVAALTRVLALNASMIAARASAQQDPEQFASIASEFDTIASQVNDLAVQTNQSLILLQQQTDRIQTVVSGVNQDVREIGNSVNQFTSSSERSRQVFDNIKAATERVAQVGQQVTQSSQAIAKAVQTTLESIQSIAKVASEAERQSVFTREQAESIDKLARVLLEKVRFFRLPSDLLASATVPKALSGGSAISGSAISNAPYLNGHHTPPALDPVVRSA